MTQEQAFARLELLGYPTLAVRALPDGRIAWVHQMLFTHAICVAYPEDQVYSDRWCYQNRDAAVIALHKWDVEKDREPYGWHRNPSTGRRRPNGDASREYVNF